MIIRRLYVTLLEMLLVIGVLVIIGGFISIQAGKVLREQRFRSEVELVVNQLRLAQDLMLIFRSNVTFHLIPSDEGAEFKLEFDTKLPEGWSKELQRTHQKLAYIRAIDFQDSNGMDVNDKNELKIRFLSGGSLMSRGIMRLATTNDPDSPGAMNVYIPLYGYPAPIVTYPTNPADLDKDVTFDEQLTARTGEELRG